VILTTAIIQQLQTQSVHTTGVNWLSVSVIVGAITAVLSTIGTVVIRMLGRQITDAIRAFQLEVITKLDLRLTTVETLLKGISTNNPRYPDDPREHTRRGH
jgi:hypothetical protein